MRMKRMRRMFDGQVGPEFVSRSHGVTHARLVLHLLSAKSEHPYKVAELRFNPKFISSISKGLSPCPSWVRGWHLRRFSLLLNSSLLTLFSYGSSLALECNFANTPPLHYEYYIAIFIIFVNTSIRSLRLCHLFIFFCSLFTQLSDFS